MIKKWNAQMESKHLEDLIVGGNQKKTIKDMSDHQRNLIESRGNYCMKASQAFSNADNNNEIA